MGVAGFKALLKSFPALVRVKRGLFERLGVDARHPVLKDRRYFSKLFETANPKSIGSLDLSRGLVRGDYAGYLYWLHFRRGDCIDLAGRHDLLSVRRAPRAALEGAFCGQVAAGSEPVSSCSAAAQAHGGLDQRGCRGR